MKKYTESAIDDFRALYPDLEIYTIGIGEFDLDYLNRLSYPNEATGTTDFRKILEQLNSVITCGVGRYSNLKVTDTLSDYVNFADDFDLKIQIVPKTAGRETIVLYENGALTTEGRKYIKSDGVKVSTRNKTVTVDFLDDFYEEGGFRYSISYNVKATEKAYSEYAENLAAGKDGYDDVLGHVDTDYLVNNNKTSSLKGGFHANKSAILEYTQTRPDGTSIDTTAEYPHPVVQVSGEELHVEKVWYDGSAKHGSDSVTVQLWITDGSGEPVSKINEATLNSANDWSAGFTDLPKSYTYTVIESKCPHGYAPIYSYEEDTSTWTITNVPAKADITLQKNGQGGTALKVSGVEFELYSDEALTELVGTYTTDANGVAALDDLTVGETYWIVETVAPSGYRRMSEARSFTVTWTDGKAALEVPFDDAYLTTDEDTVLYVRNYSGYELPESGGMGTALFTALGAALALAPLVFLAARKRRRGMAEQ